MNCIRGEVMLSCFDVQGRMTLRLPLKKFIWDFWILYDGWATEIVRIKMKFRSFDDVLKLSFKWSLLQEDLHED